MLELRLSYSCAHRLYSGAGTLDPDPTRTTALWATAGALWRPIAISDNNQICRSKLRLEYRCAMFAAGSLFMFIEVTRTEACCHQRTDAGLTITLAPFGLNPTVA